MKNTVLARELKRKFPEWVLGSALDGREFVIRLHWPRFVGEVSPEHMEEKGLVPVIQLEFIDEPDGFDEEGLFGLGAMAKDFYLEATKDES